MSNQSKDKHPAARGQVIDFDLIADLTQVQQKHPEIDSLQLFLAKQAGAW